MWRQKLTEIKEGDDVREEPHAGQARGERARQAEDNVGEERETRLEIRKKTTTRKISQQGNGSKVKLAKYKNDIKTSNREHQRKAPVRESQDAAKCPESAEETR